MHDRILCKILEAVSQIIHTTGCLKWKIHFYHSDLTSVKYIVMLQSVQLLSLSTSAGQCRVDGEAPNAYTCRCPGDLLGMRCTYGLKCHPNSCQHGGTCIEGPTSALCHCAPGFAGKFTDQNVSMRLLLKMNKYNILQIWKINAGSTYAFKRW